MRRIVAALMSSVWRIEKKIGSCPKFLRCELPLFAQGLMSRS